jgi:hypothetical protein
MIALFWGLISGIRGWLDPISKIVGQIADAKVAMRNAQTEDERIASQERVNALNARRDILLATARSDWWIRAGFALPFVIYNAKLVVWDKVLALGSTDPLSPDLKEIQMVCIGFYFLYEITSRLRR